MRSTTEAPAAPDLSSLDKRQQLNVRVALTQGWQVRFTDEEDVPYFEAGQLVGLPPNWPEIDPLEDILKGAEVDLDTRPDVFDWTWIPNYAGDPAAWGALMEREGVWPEPLHNKEGAPVAWGGRFVATGGAVDKVARVFSIGEAVSLAVLMKYGIDPTPYIGD